MGGINRSSAELVPDERLCVLAREQAVVRATGICKHQPGRIGIAREIFDIDALRMQKLMHQCEDEQTIGAWTDRHPFVRNGGIAGAHGIDRYDLDTARLELAETDLDGIGIVVLGHAEEKKISRAFPIRLAEFPERAADGVQAGGGHVDRAEAAVRGIVRGAELLCPPAR